jgi:BioD-like phosphotransacetylase family protein
MHGATVAGCITNKVPVEEYSFTREFLGPIVEGEWKIPLVGVVPMAETLDQPSMMDLEALFHAHALSGREHLLRRFSGYQLVTISLRRFLEKLSQNPQRFQNTCFVTHASRSDIIMGLLSHHKFLKSFKGGLITTGSPPGNQLQQYVIEYIKHQSLPVLNVDLSSSKTMKVIEQYTPKMKSNDQDRTGSIVDHYEPHIDFDTLIRIMRQPSCEGWLL